MTKKCGSVFFLYGLFLVLCPLGLLGQSYEKEHDGEGDTQTVANRKARLRKIPVPKPPPNPQQINWVKENLNTEKKRELREPLPLWTDSLTRVYMSLSIGKGYDPRSWKNGVSRQDLREYADDIYRNLVELNVDHFIIPILSLELRSFQKYPEQYLNDLKESIESTDSVESRFRTSIEWLQKADSGQYDLVAVLDTALSSEAPSYKKITKEKMLEAYEAFKKTGSTFRVRNIIPSDICSQLKHEVFNLKIVEQGENIQKGLLASEASAFAYTLFENKMISEKCLNEVKKYSASQ